MNALDKTDKEILKYLAEGLTAKEIAAKVNMTQSNLKKKLRSLREQTETNNTTHLVAKLLTMKLL